MADVWLVVHERPGGFRKFMALKRLLPDLVRRDVDFVHMMCEEARIGALLDHPNLCRVHDVWRDIDGCAVLMDYVRGVTLREVSAARASIPQLGDVGFVVGMAIQICRGLHCLHELVDAAGRSLGLVHCDVAPDNVMVTPSGEVVVLDLGIAAAAAETGVRMGKASYMSPEQVRAEPLDRRSDVYAVGVVVYELLAGRAAFKRDTRALTMAAVLGERPPPLSSVRPDVSRRLSQVVERALEPDRRARFATTDALAQALVAACAHGRVASPNDIAAVLQRWLPRALADGAPTRADGSYVTELDEERTPTQPGIPSRVDFRSPS